MMNNSDEYIEKLSKKYERNFKIYKDEVIENKKINLYASYKNIAGRTFITKNDVIDRYEINEHCLIKKFDNINKDILMEFWEYGKKLTEVLVKPHSEHKSSDITLVMICNESPREDEIKVIKKLKYSKLYKLSFYGSSQVNLILVDINNKKVYSSKMAKNLKKVYAPEVVSMI